MVLVSVTRETKINKEGLGLLCDSLKRLIDKILTILKCNVRGLISSIYSIYKIKRICINPVSLFCSLFLFDTLLSVTHDETTNNS